jgi:hypothetical protein
MYVFPEAIIPSNYSITPFKYGNNELIFKANYTEQAGFYGFFLEY